MTTLIDFLIATADETEAEREDARSLKYTAQLLDAIWVGPKDGQWLVKVNGKEVALSDIWGHVAINKGTKIQVRYANGKYVAVW